ncbi:hypothetical protein [Xenophilus sp.]|uniref:hypothetical protein n=1 Tax=Xenophilus sp. TaxID=1873499 RepID=UPI0037DC2BF7
MQFWKKRRRTPRELEPGWTVDIDEGTGGTLVATIALRHITLCRIVHASSGREGDGDGARLALRREAEDWIAEYVSRHRGA